MKTRQILSVMLCLIILLTTGCAETPTEDIVINKGDSQLRDKIENSEGTPLDIAEKTDGTKRETTSFISDNGIITYNIDAEVSIPDVNKVPVLKVAPHFFTSEELETISRVICGDNEIYEYSEEMTKTELEKIILGYKRRISDKDGLLEYYGDEASVERITEKYNEWIAQAEADYKNASDEVTHKPSDFEYHPSSYYTVGEGRKYIIGSAAAEGVSEFKATSNVNGIPMLLMAMERHEPFHMSDIYMYPFDFRDYQHEASYNQTTPITDEEAKEAVQLVRNALDEMGFTEVKILGYRIEESDWNDETQYGIYFACIPEYGDIEVVNSAGWSHAAYVYSGNSDTYYPTYNYTLFSITVSNGQIMGFMCESPLEVVETINENVAIMSYDEALERIYDQLKLSWTSDRILKDRFEEEMLQTGITDVKVNAARIEVQKMELVLVRTRIKDDPDNFYLLPAWVVYGDYEIDEYEVKGEKRTFEPAWYSDDYMPPPLLIINAIDGSVIDMAEGY